MDPILRRSLFFYVSTFVVFSGVLGRFLGRDAWPAFEAIPLLMPAYLISGVMFSEKGESYAFLRTLPIPDRRIVRTKFALIAVSTALYWIEMSGLALARMAEGVSSPSTLVYLSIVCGVALLLGAGCQMAVWRFGHGKAAIGAMFLAGATLVVAIGHTANLRRTPDWPVFAHTGPMEWMGQAPWLSIPVLVVFFSLAALGLMRLGTRVKEQSEAAL